MVQEVFACTLSSGAFHTQPWPLSSHFTIQTYLKRAAPLLGNCVITRGQVNPKDIQSLDLAWGTQLSAALITLAFGSQMGRGPVVQLVLDLACL